MQRYVAYVANQLVLTDSTPLQISETAVLRAATAEEISASENYLQKVSSATSVPYRDYKQQWTLKEDKNGTTTLRSSPLPIDQWRHLVLEYRGEGQAFSFLRKMLAIADPPLFFSYYTLTSESGEGYDGFCAINMSILERVERAWWENPNGTEVNASQIRDLEGSIGQVKASPEYSFVIQAIESYYDLQLLPPDSPMYLLGLFSIVESLITHRPRSAETLDSVTHQICNKIVFIDDCLLEKPHVAAPFFGSIDRVKLWKKLYSYRSQIAHTASSSLAEHGDLISRDNILKYLDPKAREIIRLAITRPQVIHRLKAC